MPGSPGDVFADDPSISDEARVLRRIPPGQVVNVPPTDRPRSDAFSNSPDGTGTSVDIWEEGWNSKDTLVDHENFGLVSLTVRNIRDAELGIVRNRIPGNPHHALIQGKKTKGKQRSLAKASQWIKRPDLPD